MKPSDPLTVEKVNSDLLEAPISSSLLIPCRVAYPLKENGSDGTLTSLYEVYIHNLGQVEKCYTKDYDLVQDVKRKEGHEGFSQEQH